MYQISIDVCGDDGSWKVGGPEERLAVSPMNCSLHANVGRRFSVRLNYLPCLPANEHTSPESVMASVDIYHGTVLHCKFYMVHPHSLGIWMVMTSRFQFVNPSRGRSQRGIWAYMGACTRRRR